MKKAIQIEMLLKASEMLELIRSEKFRADFTAFLLTVQAMDNDDSFNNAVHGLNGLGCDEYAKRLQRITGMTEDNLQFMETVKFAGNDANISEVHAMRDLISYINNDLFLTGAAFELNAVAFYVSVGKYLQHYKFKRYERSEAVLFMNHHCQLFKDEYNTFRIFDKRFSERAWKNLPDYILSLEWKDGNAKILLNNFLPATSHNMNTLIKLINEKTRNSYCKKLYLQTIIMDMIDSTAFTTAQKTRLASNLNQLDKSMYYTGCKAC